MSNSRYPIVTQSQNGYCPAQVTPSASKQILTQDPGAAGPAWETPPIATATSSGDVPTPPNNTTTFFRGDATFAAPIAPISTYLGTVSTNQTVDCTGASAVHIKLIVSAALTLTLTNLTVGVPVSIGVSGSGSSVVVKIAANDPGSLTYTVTGGSGGAQTTLSSTGLSVSSSTYFVLVGNSVYVTGVPRLEMNIS